MSFVLILLATSAITATAALSCWQGTATKFSYMCDGSTDNQCITYSSECTRLESHCENRTMVVHALCGDDNACSFFRRSATAFNTTCCDTNNCNEERIREIENTTTCNVAGTEVICEPRAGEVEDPMCMKYDKPACDWTDLTCDRSSVVTVIGCTSRSNCEHEKALSSYKNIDCIYSAPTTPRPATQVGVTFNFSGAAGSIMLAAGAIIAAFLIATIL
jgi:hypothetical protein